MKQDRQHKPEFRFDVTPVVKEAVREVAARESQTVAAFIKSCFIPYVRDEIRVIEARIKKPSANPHPKHCPKCGTHVCA